MKISTRGRYAIEIMADLAVCSGSAQLECLKNIADRRQLSEKYLERIIRGLKADGLVVSVRGVYGGYCLAREPEKISIKDILGAVEGELAPVQCLMGETDCRMDCDRCSTRGVWDQIWQILIGVTESVTLQDIVQNIK